MMPIRQICATAVLTCVFALSAFAGEMGTPIAPPSEQPTATGEMSAGITGEMGTPGAQIAGILMQGLLPLF